MTAKPVNKHELRTRETRALLLKAAETIFARDGYERAELGEIAALAGRTKGAIYAQFKSKEDIFLALVEDHTERYRIQVEQALAQSTTVEDNLAALREFYMHRISDPSWSLLVLEFKLFAIRHPESKARFSEIYDRVISARSEKKFAQILGPAARGKDSISRVAAIQALHPIITALVLEARLETPLSQKNVVQTMTNRIFDTLLDLPAR